MQTEAAAGLITMVARPVLVSNLRPILVSLMVFPNRNAAAIVLQVLFRRPHQLLPIHIGHWFNAFNRGLSILDLHIEF